MGLGDSLNSLAGGYVRGQAQYAANEKTRQEQAQAAAKAAQDAAEFRLKLAQHSQTLTNSAEAEWGAIFDPITSDEWDPAYIAKVLPRAANFDKTYGAVWGGGSAVKNLQDALHLNTVKADGALEKGQVGPQVEQAQVPNELFGYLSAEQKAAADEKARKARTSEAARDFTIRAMDYIRTPGGGLPDEATFYRKVYDFQDQAIRSGEWDMETLDKAMDIIRENAAEYYKGLANELDKATKQTALSDAISERTDKVGRNVSAWIKSLLMMDAQGNALAGDLFAERSPLQLEMERTAQSLAMQGMSEGQIKANLIFRHRDEMGGLELDIANTPYAGSLTLMDAPMEFRGAVNRYYDLNEDPNEDQTAPMWNDDPNPEVHGGWIVNLVTGEGRRIYKPIPTPETPSVIQNQGTQYPRVPAGSKAAVTSTQKQQASQEEKILTPEQQRRVDEYETFIAGPARAAGRAVPSAIEALFPDLKTGTNPFAPKGKK